MIHVRPKNNHANIFTALWAFLIAAALAFSFAISTPPVQADPAVLQPNEMTLDIAKAGSSTPLTDAELAAGMGMRDYSGGQVIVDLVPSAGETQGRQYRLTLPEFYSFTGLAESGAGYSGGTVSTSTGGLGTQQGNVFTFTVPAPDNPEQPALRTYSFKFTLNENSIDDAHVAQWKNGSWTPNSPANLVTLEKVGDSVAAKTRHLSYTFSSITAPQVRTWDTGYAYGHGASEHGKVSNYNFIAEDPFFRVQYATSELYSTGPGTATKIEVSAPDKFTFTDPGYTPKSGTDIGDAQYIGDSVQETDITRSADGKTITVTLNDPGASVSGRWIGKFTIQADAQYRDPDNPMSVLPDGEYPVKAKVYYDDGTVLEASYTYQVNATAGETGTIKANVDSVNPTYQESETVTKPLYDTAKSGELTEVGANRPIANIFRADTVANNSYASLPELKDLVRPENNGAGYSYVSEFDTNIQVSEFYFDASAVSSDLNWQNQANRNFGLAKMAVRSVTYTYTDDTTGTMADVGQNAWVQAPDGKFIKSIKVTYDELVYLGDPNGRGSGVRAPITNLKYTIPAGVAPLSTFPIDSKLLDASGKTVSETKNYILVDPQEDPHFTLTSMAPSTQPTTKGVYSTDEEQPFYKLEITDEELGAGTVIQDQLQNPWFYNHPSKYVRTGFISSGHLKLHQIMGDGKWSAEVQYLDAETLKTAGSAATSNSRTFTLPAFTADTLDVDFFDTTQFADALPEGAEIIAFTLKHEGVLDISAMSGATADKVFYENYYQDSTFSTSTGLANGYWSRWDGEEKSKGSAIDAQVHVKIDNSQDLNKKYDDDADRWLAQGGTNTVSVTVHGAEIIMPKSATMDSSSVNSQQGQQTEASAAYKMVAFAQKGANTDSRFIVQPGWTAYLKVNQANKAYFSVEPGTGSIAGVTDPASGYVTIDGVEYFKISYTGTEPVEITSSGTSMTQSYDGLPIGFKLFTSQIAPLKELTIFDDYSYLDIANADVYKHTDENGVTYTDSIQAAVNAVSLGATATDGAFVDQPYAPTWTKWSGHYSFSSFEDYSTSNWITDDPLGFYGDTPTNERNWALRLPAIKVTPQVDTQRGLFMNPGVNGIYQNNETVVYPEQQGSETSTLILNAGGQDMSFVVGTVTLPRKGEGFTYGGKTYTSTVSQYLRGPITQTVAPSDNNSQSLEVTYSLNGTDFLTQSEVAAKVAAGEAAWADVVAFQVKAPMLKANDAAQLSIPLITGDKKDGSVTPAGAKAYWGAVYNLDKQTQTARVNTYSYDKNPNDPEPSPVTVALEATKTLTGARLQADQFEFEMAAAEGNDADGYTMPSKLTATNDANGAVKFEAIEFSKAGEYKFNLSERAGNAHGYTYDDSVHTMVVSVIEDTDNNTLSASVTQDLNGAISERNPTFNNSYTPAPAKHDPPVSKIIDGDEPEVESEFSFTLSRDEAEYPMPGGAQTDSVSVTVKGAGSEEFGEIEFTEAGTYTYTVVEDSSAALTGYSYDSSVYVITYQVTDKGGQLEAVRSVTKDGEAVDLGADGSGIGVVFTNTYTQPEEPVDPADPADPVKPADPEPSIEMPPTGSAGIGELGAAAIAIIAIGGALSAKRRRS